MKMKMFKSLFTAEGRTAFIQFFRFSFVGFVTNVTIFLLYLLFTSWGAEPKIVMTILYFSNAIVCFIFNWKWVFYNNEVFLNASGKYMVSQVIGYVLNWLVLACFADYLGYPHQWVQAGGVTLNALFFFLAFKYYVFPSNLQHQRQ